MNGAKIKLTGWRGGEGIVVIILIYRYMHACEMMQKLGRRDTVSNEENRRLK
jgi:hypothetical protein